MKILVTYDMFRKGFTELESKYEVKDTKDGAEWKLSK